MPQREQSLEEVGSLSKGTASTPMMCGEPAGKPWSCEGEENSRNKAGIAQIWYDREKARRVYRESRIVRNALALYSTSDFPDISRVFSWRSKQIGPSAFRDT